MIMESTLGDLKNEITSWLKFVLKIEDVEDLAVNILGNSEKGDGYIGDIVFVCALVTSKNGLKKEFNLTLKCSKRSKALRESSPVKEAFHNEIYVYDVVFPTFIQFQREKGIEDVFNSVAKFYGTFTDNNTEIIVFENLKNIGYALWDKKKPLTRKHIDLVVNEYGKFHATSLALKDQDPTKFEKLITPIYDVFKQFADVMDIDDVFGSQIEEVYNLLKNDINENVLIKWKNLRDQVRFILCDMTQNVEGLKVITHGDCWNNNFMFKDTSDLKVAILDWQISYYTSPIFDLSYFIFTCISKEDINDIDDILKNYYETFANYLKRLGSDPNKLYRFDQFLEEWKKYCKYGIVMTSLLMKIVSTEKDEVLDIAQAAETGEGFAQAFSYDVKDKDTFKNRMSYIVKYVVENDII